MKVTEQRSISKTSFELVMSGVVLALASEVMLLVLTLLAWGMAPEHKSGIVFMFKLVSLFIWSGGFFLLLYMITRFLLAQIEILTNYDLDRDGAVGSIQGWSPGMLSRPYNPTTGIIPEDDDVIESIVARALLEADIRAPQSEPSPRDPRIIEGSIKDADNSSNKRG